VTKEVTLTVPVGATQLFLEPGLWGSKGLFEIDDLVVKVTEIAPIIIPVDAPWPATQKVAWGAEPVEVQSSKRARISLNGAWKFSPPVSVSDQANTAPEKGWGYMAVPGNWRRHQEVIARGIGPQWTQLDLRRLAGAWYERRFKVPADWNGRHISIDFDRISTDATFWVNDKPAGSVNWPEGELDITNLVRAGEDVTLRAFVVATIEPGDVLVMMGEAPGQNWTAKRELKTAGLVGNVTLQSRPRAAYVSDVYVQPSVRKKQLGVDIELSGVTENGPVQLVASLVDENGKEEKRFTQTVNATAGATQRVKANWTWENPRLWDYKQPNMYTLRLTAKGAGLDDEPVAKFGFRETWIEGRQVFLNGTPFRMRPTLIEAVNAGAGSNNLTEAQQMGFNFGEIWPEGTEERSADSRYTDWYDKADKAGFPISGMTPHMGWMGGNINSPAKQAAYRAATERVLRRYRNHPSIIMWGTSGNMFGSLKDPKYVGTIEASRAVEAAKGTPTSAAIPWGELGVSIIKSIDPTRPVFVHNGGSAGDIYTSNHYLNFIPLQEREEWLSNYVVNGEMPLMYVEFGTPVNISLMRGRNGFQNAYRSEHWLTEFASSIWVTKLTNWNQLITVRKQLNFLKKISLINGLMA
jgi:beta-galactosidase